MNLGGLSAAYGGFQAAENTQALTEQNQTAAKESALKLLGAHVLGRALTGQQPGMPGGGPQPPAPGQPSVPSQPPPQAGGQPMAQGGGAPAPAPQPAAGPAGAPPAQGGSGLPEMNLQQLTSRILQTSPRVKDHPEVLMAALERAAPILDRQSKEDLAEMRKAMSTERLAQAGQLARARQESLDSWRGAQGVRTDRRLDQADDRLESLDAYRKRTGDQRDTAEIGRDGRFAAGQQGQNDRAAARNDRTDRRLDQADTREGRLAVGAAIRQDQGYQRLEQQKQEAERKALAGGDKQALAQWRAVVDAQHKYAMERINANSIGSNLKKPDRDALLAEQNAAYKAAIADMRQRMEGGPTAPIGTSQPSNGPAPAPTAVQPPPISMLQPGGVNIINGVGWRLQNGQAVQVPVPAGQ